MAFFSVVLTFAMLAAVSCGAGGEEGAGGSPTGDPPPGARGGGEKAPGSAEGAAGPPPVSSSRDVRGAVVPIQGSGTGESSRDPETG